MKNRAFIYIILAGVLWGTSGIFVHYLAPLGFSSMQMTGVRGVVSFIALSLFFLLKDKSVYRVTLPELLIFAAIGAMLYLAAAFYYSSMQLTSVSTAVVLMYTAPIIVSVFSALFFGEKFTPIKTVAVGVMLVGCALVAGIAGGIAFDPLGILFAFGASATYAGYNILTKWAMRRGSRPESSSIYSFLFMSLIALCASDPVGTVSTAVKNPWPSVPLLIGLGVCTFVLPYFLYTLSLKHLPAGTASALSIIEPLSATVFSIILFDEALTVPTGIGIALIIGAVFVLGISDNEKKKEKTVDTVKAN